MPDRQPTFQEAALGFNPYRLREEFAPFVDAWKAGPQEDITATEKPIAKKITVLQLAEALLRRVRKTRGIQIPEEIQPAAEEATPYNQMVEYAVGAVALGRHYQCGDTILRFLKRAAFEIDQTRLAEKFDTDVRRKILQKQEQTPEKDILDYETITAIMAEVNANVNQTLTFGHTVLKAQQEAEKHYKSDKFQREVTEMLRNARRIENRTEAWDLEGVLIANRLKFMAPKGKSASNSAVTRVRRPGANELLAELARRQYGNKIFLWTGLSKNYADEMITRSGLIVPENVRIFYDENTREKLEESMPFQEQFLANSGKLNEHDRDELEAGRRKIIGYNPMGVTLDYLYDDFADRHLKAAMTICNISDEEAKKYSKAEPFWISTETELERHHEDRGLFYMMQNGA